MIRHKNRVHKGFSLMPETIAKIKVKAIEDKLKPSHAGTIVVHERARSIEMKPLYPRIVEIRRNLSKVSKIAIS